MANWCSLDPLDLSGLTELSEVAATILCRIVDGFPGEILNLNGLTELSHGVGFRLSCHKGYLSLTGLIKLDDSDANNFSCRPEGELCLSACVELSDAAREMLASLNDEEHRLLLLESELTELSGAATEKSS